MKIEEITTKIINLVNQPNDYTLMKQNTYSFKDKQGNNSITIYGTEKNAKYNDLFNCLGKELKIFDETISLKSFQDKTQQLLFQKKFNETEIRKVISSYQKSKHIRVIPIYGVDFVKGKNIQHFGKYTVLKGNSLKRYVVKETGAFWPKKDPILDKLTQNKVLLATTYEVKDTLFINDIFKEDSKRFIDMIRFMSGIKDDRIYIDMVEFIPYLDNAVTFSNQSITSNSNIHAKYNPLILNGKYFNSKKHGFDYLWNLLDSNVPDIDDRILTSIKWISMSIDEERPDMSQTELAFAYESLLRVTKDAVINPSIQSSIAEATAILSGRNLSERLLIIKKFKKFYGYRSSIVHGGSKKDDIPNYYEMLDILRTCIFKIVKMRKKNEINSIEELYSFIDNRKYR